jgi:hypothetical protein
MKGEIRNKIAAAVLSICLVTTQLLMAATAIAGGPTLLVSDVIKVPIFKSRNLTMKQSVSRVSVGNDKIADILILRAKELYMCQRPLIVTGGELSAAMLEVNFDATTRTYKAPLQLKANNGILLLDDLGRQKIAPVQLFNRWIIPLEERRDFLSLPNGLHFEIPFELILLFSTNLAPQDLVDDAFLRRLGYKIKFTPMSLPLYQQLWFKTCDEYQLDCDEELFSYLVEQRHYVDQKEFLPCIPRDLLSIVSDQIKFNQLEPKVTQALLCFAWQHYFV